MNEWKPKALCRQHSPDVWFPERGRRGAARRSRDVDLAAAICRDCPVRAECAAYALKRTVGVGVWAGVDLGESLGPVTEDKAARLMAIANRWDI